MFEFSGYSVNKRENSISFSYRLITSGRGECFTEKIIVPDLSWRIDGIPPELLGRVLESLLLMLGISYWKLYCPKYISTGSIVLTAPQAQFWNTVYTKGLGEFFYGNAIDFRGLVQFPYKSDAAAEPIPVPSVSGSLVQLGGGKDSVVTGELLREHNVSFNLACLNTSDVQKNVARVMDKTVMDVQRILDPRLFELNKQSGVYNGHIPISAVYAFVDLLIAVLYGYHYIIASNEESASYGNVRYNGEEINHQWSKSWEFEQLFRRYVADFITPSVSYFSLLRPLKEIKIVELFIRYKQYFPVFSSCNQNFRIQNPRSETLWCGECPKCAFVFLLLSAFLPKLDVMEIFHKNLFDDEKLVSIFEELLGLVRFKPFECVGTPEESRWALWRVMQKKEYDNDVVIKKLKAALPVDRQEMKAAEKRLFGLSTMHAIPEKFASIVHSL